MSDIVAMLVMQILSGAVGVMTMIVWWQYGSEFLYPVPFRFGNLAFGVLCLGLSMWSHFSIRSMRRDKDAKIKGIFE